MTWRRGPWPAAVSLVTAGLDNKALQQTKPGGSSRSARHQSGPKASFAGLLGPPTATIERQLGAPASLLNAMSLAGRTE